MNTASPSKAQVSAVMITYNADRRLEQVLQSLQWCDDVVVVDSQSTDQTLPLATQYGARIFQRTFDNFSAQKQFSVDRAKHDWVLVIDSDEVVTAELRAQIEKVISKVHPTDTFLKGAVTGYEVPRVLYFLGKKISHSGGIDFPLRLFQKKFGKFCGSTVHERVEVKGPVQRLSGFLEHYSYDSIEAYHQKFDRYTSLAAQALYDRGKSAPLYKIGVSFPVTFFKLYFLKLGILDGYAGFLWCFYSAASPVVKYSKLAKLWKHAPQKV